LSDAESEASWLRGELVSSYGRYGDNPILLIHPYCDCYRSFGDFVTEPYVTRNSSVSYLKPLDIVKTYTTRFGFGFYHVGIYLGKIDGEFKVCHFTNKENNTTIDKWNKFKEGEIIDYHPIVPFKNYKDIAKQIVWAKDNNFRSGNYNLRNRNCEHFANMVVYGINYSEQIENKQDDLTALNLTRVGASTAADGIEDTTLNNDKGSTIKLTNEISESDGKLGKKSDWETEKYEEKYLQEVPPKEYCKIM
jgi:Lecithin retinol acyltransferase